MQVCAKLRAPLGGGKFCEESDNGWSELGILSDSWTRVVYIPSGVNGVSNQTRSLVARGGLLNRLRRQYAAAESESSRTAMSAKTTVIWRGWDCHCVYIT